MKLPRKKREETSATVVQTLWLVLACCALCGLTAYAADPAWWSSPGTGSQSAVVTPQVTTNNGVVSTNYVPNDYAVVTQGQLKQFTARAVDELNTNLPGGAGTNLNSMVSNWASDYATNGYNATNIKPSDYTAMNVGQLKYIGNKVWAPLVAAGYTNAAPAWLQQNTNTDNIVATLGQLKEVFNFDLAFDSDNNGLPDWWEIKYFGQIGNDPTATDSATGLTYGQDYLYGLIPGSGTIDSNGIPYAWEVLYFNRIGIDPTIMDSSTGLSYGQEYQYGVTPGSGPTDGNGLPYAWEMEYFGQVEINPDATDPNGLTNWESYQNGLDPTATNTMDSNDISYAWEEQYFGQIGVTPSTMDSSTGLTYGQDYNYGVTPGSGPTDWNGLPYTWEIQYFNEIDIDPSATDPNGLTNLESYENSLDPTATGTMDGNDLSYTWEVQYFGHISLTASTTDSTTGLTYLEEYNDGVNPGSGLTDSNVLPYAWEMQYFGRIGVDPTTTGNNGITYLQSYQFGLDPNSSETMDSNDISYAWEIQYFNRIEINPDDVDPNGLTNLESYELGFDPTATGTMDSNEISYAWEEQYFGQIGITPSTIDSSTGLTYLQEYQNSVVPDSGPTDSNGISYAWEVQYYGQTGLNPTTVDSSTGVAYGQEYQYGVIPGSGTTDIYGILPYAWEIQYYAQIGLNPWTIDSSTGVSYLDEYYQHVIPGSGLMDSNGLPYAWESSFLINFGTNPNTIDSTNGLTYLQDYEFGLEPNFSGPIDYDPLTYTWEVQYFGRIEIDPNSVDSSTGLSYGQEFQDGVVPGSGPMDDNGLPYAWEMEYFNQIGVDSTTIGSNGITYLQSYQYGLAPNSSSIDSAYNVLPYAWEVQYIGQIGLNPGTSDPTNSPTGLTYGQEYQYSVIPGSGPIDSAYGVLSYVWEIQYCGAVGIDPTIMDSSTGLTYGQEYTTGVNPGSGTIDPAYGVFSYAWEIQYFGAIGLDPNDDPDGDGYSNIYEYTHGTDPTTASAVPTPDFVVDAGGTTSYPTIQSAIDALTSDYQIIAVMPGTYQEKLSSTNYKVMLRSTNGAASTIIDAQQNGSAIILGQDSIIDDFTILHSSGPAVDVEPGPDDTDSNVNMVNCVLYGNQSDSGILYANASNLTVANCTLLNNALNSGSTTVETNHGTATLVNSILWDGGNEIGVDSSTFQSTVTATNCDIEGATVYAGLANISADPLLTSDGHLMSGSPCIDAGTSTGAPNRDMDNEARPAGAAYDIGADEYIDSDGQGLPDWWQWQYFGQLGNAPASPDSNGLTLLEDYEYGIAPTIGPGTPPTSDPILTIVSGDGQVGGQGGLVPQALVVKVTNTDGAPVANAVVTFTTSDADGELFYTLSDWATGESMQVNTDVNGEAWVYYLQNWDDLTTINTVTASMGEQSVMFTQTTGLVGWWEFNDSSSLYDYSQEGYVGSFPANYPNVVPGISFPWEFEGNGEALQFSGADEYGQVAEPSFPNFGSQSFSLLAWFQTSITGQVMPLFSKQSDDSTGYHGFHLGLNASGNIEAKLGDSTGASPLTVSTQASFTDGLWHQVILLVDQTNQNATIYVDGVAQSLQLGAGSVGTVAGTQVTFTGITNLNATVAQPLYLGGNPVASQYFSGLLENFQIYDIALTGPELGTLIDSDNNGLPDWWEVKYFGQTGNDPNSSPEGNGLTLLQDYEQGNDPFDYFSQGGAIQTPTLAILSGNNQSSFQGMMTAEPFVVQVTDSSGNPMIDAPVTFTVSADTVSANGGQVGADPGSTFDVTLQTTTNANGEAVAYYQQQPGGTSVTNIVNVTTGVTTAEQSVTFTETTLMQVGGWLLNDGSTTTATDSSTVGNNGILVGSPLSVSTTFGAALQLSGTGQYGQVPDSSSLDLGTDCFTLSAWFQTSTTGQVMPIFSKQVVDSTGYHGFHLGLNASGNIEAKLGDSTGASPLTVSTQASFTDGLWHQVILLVDQANQCATIYVDGVAQSLQLGAGSVGAVAGAQVNFTGITDLNATVAQPLYLGGNPTASQYFTGILYNLSVYNYALSGTDLTGMIDSNGDGLPDAWEIQTFGNLIYRAWNSSPDGNGFTLLQDYLGGADPTNYYSQPGTNGPVIITPTITVISGNNQTGPQGTFLSGPLIVEVTDASGNPLVNAPVTFTSTDTPGGFALAPGGSASNNLSVSTDAAGTALVYYAGGSGDGVTNSGQITAGTASTTFSESTQPNNGSVADPTKVTAIYASGSGGGEIDVSWANNASNATSFILLKSVDGVTWTPLTTINDPTATRYAMTGWDTTHSYPGKSQSYFGVIAVASAGQSHIGGTNAKPAPRYAVIDLGPNLSPASLNNNGDVVGNPPFLWHQGTVTGFSTAESWSFTLVYDIVNPTPDSDPPDPDYATVVRATAQATFTPDSTTVNDINDSGVIVGSQHQLFIPDNTEGVYAGGYASLGVGVCWAGANQLPTLLSDPDTVAASFNPGDNTSNFGAVRIGNNNQVMGVNGGYWYSLGDVATFFYSVVDPTSIAPVVCMNRNGNMVVADGRTGTIRITSTSFATNQSVGAITDFTDTAPYIFVGLGSICDNLDLIHIQGYRSVSVSSPSDLTKAQVISNNPPSLMEKILPAGSPSGTQPSWIAHALALNDLLPANSGWQLTSVAKINNNGAIVGTATYTPPTLPPGQSPPANQPAAGQHGVMLLPIEFVYETQKGNGDYKVLDKLPIFQPDTGAGETSTFTSTYGVYEFQLAANITTSAVASMNVHFSNATGSFSGTLTETAANSGVFHDAASTVTLNLPVGTTTSTTTADALTATVTSSALGLSGVSMTFQESGANTLVFNQPCMDMAVQFPAGGLSTTAVDTITLEYTWNEVTTDATLTETGANTNVFHSSDGTISLSIVGTPSFNPNAPDTMLVQVAASGLFSGTIACQLNETGVNTCIFSNFSITYGDKTPDDPGTSSDGVFYVRLKGMTLPPGQTMNMSVCAGADPDITGSTPTGANYVQSSPILLVPPGSGSPSYSGITTVSMDAVTSLVKFGFMGQVAQITKKAATTAFLATGALDGKTLAAMPTGVTTQKHLDGLDGIIGAKTTSWLLWSKPPLLGFANSVTQTDLTINKLKSEVGKNHSLFYILTHSTGTHVAPGGPDNTTFAGFNVWQSGTMFYKTYVVTASDISDNIGTSAYDLVFINGCASANDNFSAPATTGMATAYKNAFNTHAYVGWDVPILLDDAVPDAVSFFNALGPGAVTVTTATRGITATEAFDGGDYGGTITNSTTLDAKFDDGVIINRNAPPPAGP